MKVENSNVSMQFLYYGKWTENKWINQFTKHFIIYLLRLEEMNIGLH